jgi:cold shock CspA family protein
VQATVRTFDRATRTGSVLLDDGTELPFDAAAFDVSGLRHVRLGQRVRVRLDESATWVVALTLATFDLSP